MTDIKLKADCELAKAIDEYALASAARVHKGRNSAMRCTNTRAHLLEVIQDRVRTAIRETWAGDNRDSLEIANEIMGVVSDD